MNYCAIRCNGSSFNDSSMVCPKPRRVGLVNTSFNDSSRPLRWQLGHQAELDARAGSELLDIILSKGGHAAERPSSQVATTPPFFCGSPPSRVANPLVHDARFKEEKQLVPSFSPIQPSPIPRPSGSVSSPNSSARKGGCAKANLGNNPAVRIEGV